MNNKEAISKLRQIKNYYHFESFAKDNEYKIEALELAIKVLEEKSQSEWIPVSKRLPDNETEVLIQYGESMMVGYHIFDRTLYPFGYEDENETGWYDSKDDFICGSDEVIAWMPLPEPYKESENANSN